MGFTATGSVHFSSTTSSYSVAGVNGYSTGAIEVFADSPQYNLPALLLSTTNGQLAFRASNPTAAGSILVQSVAGPVSLQATAGDFRVVNTVGGIKVGSTGTIDLISTATAAGTIDSMRFTSGSSMGFRSVTGNIKISNSDVFMEVVQDKQLLINSGGTISMNALLVFVQAINRALVLDSTRGGIKFNSNNLISFESTNLLLQGQSINVNANQLYLSGENNGLYVAGTLATLNAKGSQTSTRGVKFQSLLIYTPPAVLPNQTCKNERAIAYRTAQTNSICICQDGYWRCLAQP